ncbi:MAG: hypothetical protein ACLSHC_01280 [Bilophila wadsworthia]
MAQPDPLDRRPRIILLSLIVLPCSASAGCSVPGGGDGPSPDKLTPRMQTPPHALAGLLPDDDRADRAAVHRGHGLVRRAQP